MISGSIRRFCLIAFALVIGFQIEDVSAAETAWSVEMLNSRKADWEQLIGAPIRVEGRISIAGRGHLKLAKCDVSFLVSDVIPKSLVGKAAVELFGRFKRDNGKLVFDVDKLEMIPTDLEQFETRSSKFRNTKPEEWYALGDWATDRSRFYEDAELAKKALTAYEHGINAAWRDLAADDAAGRFELAKKVTQYKLPDSRRMEFLHEGYRIEWQSLIKSKQNDRDVWAQLAERMAKDLPGSNKPLIKLPENLRVAYDREPLATYRTSSELIRTQLNRLLYIGIILHPILEEAQRDGSNGDAIADRILQQVPEATALASQYRNSKLAWKFDRASTATRDEIEQLAIDLRAVQQPDLAHQALQTWIKAREPRLRETGTLGLLQLAEEHRTLLKDESTAAAILMEAYKKDPSFTDITERLNSLGYSLVGGTWMKGAPIPGTVPENPNPVPSGAGVTVGMTASQLAAALGRPGSITRVMTKRGTSEVWSYQPIGTSRLIVRLERADQAAEATVIDVR